MVFQQTVSMENMELFQYASQVCREHPECGDCPLRKDVMQFGEVTLRCETGLAKG